MAFFFFFVKFCWNIVVHIHLCVVCGYFCTETAELSICDRDMAYKCKILTVPLRKSLSTPVGLHFSFKAMDYVTGHQGKGPLKVSFSSVQLLSQLCLTLCDPMDCSTPGFPVHHQLLELTQTHVHWVSDAIQPFHPLLSPSPPAFNLSQHQGLFQEVSSYHQVAKILNLQLKHQSFQWIFRTHFLYDWLVGSPCSPRDLQVFSNTTVQKHQFFSAQLSL